MKKTRIISLIAAAAMLAGTMPATLYAEEGVVEVTIPSYRTGEDVGAKFFLPQVERFNEEYAGKYKIIVIPTRTVSSSLRCRESFRPCSRFPIPNGWKTT